MSETVRRVVKRRYYYKVDSRIMIFILLWALLVSFGCVVEDIQKDKLTQVVNDQKQIIDTYKTHCTIE